MSGQVALVTGAGIGLGRATALALADAGYHVMVTDVLPDEGRSVVAEIIERGGAAEFHALDVTDTATANTVVGRIQDQYGAVSALVLNAGIARTLPLGTLEDAAWDETMNVNLKGMMRVMRAAIPGMQENGAGAIVCHTLPHGTLTSRPHQRRTTKRIRRHSICAKCRTSDKKLWLEGSFTSG